MVNNFRSKTHLGFIIVQGADKLWRHLLKRRFFAKCAEFTCYFYFFVITMYFVIIFMYYLPLVGFLFRMVAPNSKRPMMIILHQAGYQTKDIVKLLKISRTTVQKTVKRSKEIGSVADRSGRSRKRSARMEQNKKKLRDMIRRNSRRSIRKMVKKLKINEKSIGIIIRKDLGLNSYRIQKKSTNSQTKLYQTDLKDTDSFPKGFLRHATKRSFFRMRKYSQLNFS